MADSLLLSSKRDLDEKEKQAAQLLHYLPFITFSQVGNPLERMPSQQRLLFFDSLFRTLHLQRVEDSARTATQIRGALVSASLAGVAAMRTQQQAQQTQEKKAAGEQEAKKAAGWQEEKKAAGQTGLAVLPAWQALGAGAAEAQAAGQKLALVLDDYARGDAARAKGALSDFQSGLSSQNYKADDLMAVLLLVIEDRIWAGEEAGLEGAKSGGSRSRNMVIPTRLRQSAMESAEVRLASVREMLRYYFERHPKEYAVALASALGITADQEDDVQFLQERMAFELASVGSFALSQKLLAAAKRKMDHNKCMIELGYFYDRKKKRLVLGKRTCGRPAEAKGIIGLLMGGVRQDRHN